MQRIYHKLSGPQYRPQNTISLILHIDTHTGYTSGSIRDRVTFFRQTYPFHALDLHLPTSDFLIPKTEMTIRNVMISVAVMMKMAAAFVATTAVVVVAAAGGGGIAATAATDGLTIPGIVMIPHPPTPSLHSQHGTFPK